MIEFKVKDENLELRIESGIATQKNVYILTWNCKDQCYSTLLRDHLHDRLSKKLEQIRREAYELGWREAKSKKVPKRIWFWAWW